MCIHSLTNPSMSAKRLKQLISVFAKCEHKNRTMVAFIERKLCMAVMDDQSACYVYVSTANTCMVLVCCIIYTGLHEWVVI